MKLVLLQPQHILFVLSLVLSAPMLASLLPFSYQILPHGLQVLFRPGSKGKLVKSLESIGYRIGKSVDLLRLKSSISYASLVKRQNNIFDILSSKQIKQIGQILLAKGCDIVARFQQKLREECQSEYLIVLCVKDQFKRISLQIDKCVACLDTATSSQLLIQHKQQFDQLLVSFEERFDLKIQRVTFNQRCFLLFRNSQTCAYFRNLILRFQNLSQQLWLQVVMDKLEYNLAMTLPIQFPAQFLKKENQRKGGHVMRTKGKHENQLKRFIQTINGSKYQKIQVQVSQKVETIMLVSFKRQLNSRIESATSHVALSPLWICKERVCFQLLGEVKQGWLKPLIHEVIGRQLTIISIKQKEQTGRINLKIDYQKLENQRMKELFQSEGQSFDDLSSLDFSRVMKTQYFT